MRSKSSLFLIELIISTLFFALAGTVCVQMFVKAHLINEENSNKNQAILWSQNLAETYLTSDGDLGATASYFEGSQVEGKNLTLYFDQNWNSVSSSDAAFEVVLTGTSDASYHYGQIAVYNTSDTSTSLYSLNTTKHIQERSGDNE